MGSEMCIRDSIVVVENRIQRTHFKQPYARNWLTNISLNLLRGLIDDRIVQLLERVGDRGFMGVPIQIFETLLLLACKSVGVKFIFHNDLDYSFVTNSSIDFCFDATGNRLKERNPTPNFGEAPVTKEYSQLEYGSFETGFSKFGVSALDSTANLKITTIQHDGFEYPALLQHPIKIAMFKVSNIPIQFHDEILNAVRQDNSNNRFYFWPGTLAKDVNRSLLIVNLKKNEYEWLAREIQRPTCLSIFLADFADHIETQTLRVLQLIQNRNSSSHMPENIMVEPPFLFKPYVRVAQQSVQTFYGKPLVPIGDSIFIGNPKTGNGLSKHLFDIGVLHDKLANNFSN